MLIQNLRRKFRWQKRKLESTKAYASDALAVRVHIQMISKSVIAV